MAINEYQGGFCDICGKEFKNMAQHLKTKKHIAKANSMTIQEKTSKVIPEAKPEIDKETELKTLLKKVAPSIYANEQPTEEVAPHEEKQIEEVAPHEEKQIEEITPDEGGISIWFVLAIPIVIIIAFAAFILTRDNES